MFRLLSKNKGCDRNAIAFCSLFVAVLCLASRVFSQRNERYVRVMSSAGAQRRRYERRKKVGERKREREREREETLEERVSVSAWRSAEAQAVSKKCGKVCHASEPRARSCPHHGNSAGVLLSAEHNTVGGTFSRSLPRAKGGSTSRNRGRPTNDFSRN